MTASAFPLLLAWAIGLAAGSPATPAVAPDASKAMLAQGLESFRAGNFSEARDAFEKAVALDPQSGVAVFNLASALFELKQYADAESAYVSAARLDKSVAPLALYNAGLCAAELEQLDRATELFQSSQDLASAAGRSELAEKAKQAREAMQERHVREARARMLALARAGKEALHTDHVKEAIGDYREALVIARQIGVAADDQAELYFGLASAELRDEDTARAVLDFQSAVDLSPREAEFHLMLGVACYRAGEDGRSEAELNQALALGLPADERKHAEAYLDLLWDRRIDSRRSAFEARVALGYDSDVPQSGAIPSLSTSVSSQSAAAYVGADFNAQWRPLGDSRTGALLEYRFSQTAYISVPLDPYSIQEHDLEADGTWTPARWLTLDLDVTYYLQFAGIETFGPFQDGFHLTPRAVFREGRSFETVASYTFTPQWSLDPSYDYLTGTRSDFAASENLRLEWGRITLTYQFHLERVGNERVSVTAIPFPCPAAPTGAPPCPPAATNVYVIPYSYDSQEVTLGGAANLPASFRARLDLDFEYRPYVGQSFIVRTLTNMNYYPRTRTDHRYTLDASLSRAFSRQLALQLEYTLQVNVSDIDYNVASTRLDYDDKNFVRQVIELSLNVQF